MSIRPARPVLGRALVAVFMILGIGLVLILLNLVAHLDSNDLIAMMLLRLP